jgi:hypothetical protein
MSIFTLAARYRELFLSNTVKLAREALERGTSEPPFAWIVPPDQRDPGTAARMLEILQATGIEVHRAEEAFTANDVPWPPGTFILYCAQPYRAYLNDIMEPQKYPERLQYPGGPPEPPYDAAGWTLPLQMGVRRVAVARPFECRTKKLDAIPRPQTEIRGSGGNFVVRAGANDDFRLANRLHRAGIPFTVVPAGVNWKDGASAIIPAGSLFFSGGGKVSKDLPGLLEGLSCSVARAGNPDGKTASALRAAKSPRVALYQSWRGNMDEGWTRLVLEQFEFAFSTLHDAEIRAGDLRKRYDCIILPSAGTGSMIDGNAPDTTEPQYVGGIGSDGLIALQRFAEEGGTLVCIDEACNLPISHFNIPVRNILTGKKPEEFFCPGSILRVRLEAGSALGYGLPEWVSGYFFRSQAFEVVIPDPKDKDADRSPARKYPATVTARYGETSLLESGWIRGDSLIVGKPAIMEISYGKGHIVLFGFRVQHRAQAHGTFRLLFNAIRMSAEDLREAEGTARVGATRRVAPTNRRAEPAPPRQEAPPPGYR